MPQCQVQMYVLFLFVSFLFVQSFNRRTLNEKMKTETKQLTRHLSTPALLFFPVSKERRFDIDVGETTGSGSSKAAHPSLSFHIRTICMGASRRVILSMQSRCHAVSAHYTSVETASLPPTHVLMNTQAHTIFLMEYHIYLKYGL